MPTDAKRATVAELRGDLSHSTTLAPDCSMRSAAAKPMPCAPPVITATRPFRSIWFIATFP